MYITLITVLISLIGILLLVFLFKQNIDQRAHLKLSKHRRTAEGLADLLNYAAVIDDGVIVNKNGSLMAAWIYRGDDESSSDKETIERNAAYINRALQPLGGGWMVHVDAIRRPAPGYSDLSACYFNDPISVAIDEERREYYNGLDTLYEGFFVLVLTYFPPVLAERKFIELMFDDDKPKSNKHKETQQLVDSFKREVANFSDRLSIPLKLKRLKAVHHVDADSGKEIVYDDFLSWLHYCITGLSHKIILPDVPMYLDKLIGCSELHTGVVPLLGKNYIQVVSIDGFPSHSYPGILTKLGELAVEYRWSTRFIFMDQHESIVHLEKFRKKWKQKVRGFLTQIFNTASTQVDQDAAEMVADAGSAIAETNSGYVAQGYYTSVVVIMDEDRKKAEDAARFVAKQINIIGFTARIETINTMDAFMGSLPGHGVENVRRPLLNTLNLSDLIPTSGIWTGLNYAPCPFYPPDSPPLFECITHGRSPFRFNMHVGDVGHLLLIGPTGNGKSVLLGLIATQLTKYKDMQVFAFDKGMSIYTLCKALGGLHFNVGEDESLAFSPFMFLESPSDRAWIADWVISILNLNGIIPTPSQKNSINRAIQSMYDNGSNTFSEFSLSVQDEEIREAIQQYTIDGVMGKLFDAKEDGLHLSNFSVFEIEELMNLKEAYALPVLLYLFRRIERSLDGRPSVIILDEAWLMLANPTFKDRILEWLRVLRKSNCAVIMATQSLSEAVQSGILPIILEACKTKVFLPNSKARTEEIKPYYVSMGLNNSQINTISKAIPKRQYYYSSDLGSRLFELELGKLALSFIAVNKESVLTVQKLIEAHGDNWKKEWLKINNIEAETL